MLKRGIRINIGKKKYGAVTYLKICMVLVCAFITVSCGKRDTADVTIHVQTAADRMVRVVCGEKSGSGVIYDTAKGDCFVVTAAHVLEGQTQTEVIWRSKETADALRFFAEEIEIVQGLDLAFLKLPETVIADGPEECVEEEQGHAAVVSGKDKQEDAAETFDGNRSEKRLILYGFDGNGEWKTASAEILYEWIYLEDFRNYMMVVSADTVEGMSGGGVFDQNGELEGIICGKNNREQVAVLTVEVIDAEYAILAQNMGVQKNHK